MRRSGFTLVELAIVLVIIGLLIAGILVAQSMITTSKINAQAVQINQFDAGVASFKDRYRYLPGDAPAFGGNGDGVIANTCCGMYTGIFSCEMIGFWNNINPNEFTTPNICTTSGIATQTKGAGKNVPLAKIGISNAFVLASAMGSSANWANANTSDPRNYYAILVGSQAQSPTSGEYAFVVTTSSNSAVKPAEAFALDKKLDDGTANTGYVISGSMAGGLQAGLSSNVLSSCSVGANYITSNNTYECTPLFRIGAQTGDPQ